MMRVILLIVYISLLTLYTNISNLGLWRGLADIPQKSFEDSEKYLEGNRKELLIQFLRKMLQWDPEKRPSARELLNDPWLNTKALLDD